MSDPLTLTCAQVREIDRRAADDFGIPGVVLMENAGRNAAEIIRPLVPPGESVVVVCGPGNNGGDGFVIARHLANAGIDVRIILACDPARLTGDAAINYAVVRKMALPLDRLSETDSLRAALVSASVIVDALLGTGFTGNVRPPLDAAIDAINAASNAVIVAVDVPSGLDCDTGRPSNATVRAHHTITFVALKRGFSTIESRTFTGKVHVADIGAPRSLILDVARGNP